MAQQNVTLKASGLYSFPNPLGAVPDGAFSDVNNVVIDKNGIVNPRRGFQTYGNSFGSSGNTLNQLILYKSAILRQWGSELDADSNGQGDFIEMNTIQGTGYPAIVNPVSPGLRIKYGESNGNLYFTTSNGIMKIACLDIDNIATKPVTIAGGVQALDGTAQLNNTPGWFTQDSVVAYRIVWGITDENTNVVLGVPSSRIILYNPLQSLLVQNFNTLLSDLALVASAAPYVTTGTVYNTNTITGISTTNLSVGMTVTGTFIPADTTITAIGSGTITISNAATASTPTSESLTFGQVLNYADFLSLILPADASSADLYSSLIALAQVLDTNLGETTYYGLSGTITNITPTYTTTLTGNTNSNTTISGLPTNGNLEIGMLVSATGIPPNTYITALPSFPNGTTATISNAATTSTSTSFTFTMATIVTSPNHDLLSGEEIVITGSNSSPIIDGDQKVTVLTSNTFTVPTITTIGGTTGSWTQFPLSIAQNFPTPPVDPATDTMLLSVQSFIQSLLTALDSDTGISAYALQLINGSFGAVTTAITANVIFTIPYEITTAHYYQVYRSAIFSAIGPTNIDSVVPDDELQLIVEGNPTTQDLANKFINFFDDVPDSFRAGGAYLYTNANSGQGITQAYYTPPLANDMCLYSGSMFYANTQTLYQQQIGLLSALGLAGGFLTISSATTTSTYSFVTEVAQVLNITTIAGSALTQTGTADSFTVYSADNQAIYTFWFNVGTVTAPTPIYNASLVEVTVLNTDTATQVATKLTNAINGLLGFVASSTGDVVTLTNSTAGFTSSPINNVVNVGFMIAVSAAGAGNDAALGYIGVSIALTPSQQIAETAQNIITIVNQTTASPVNAYYESTDNTVPGLILFVSKSFDIGNFYVTGSTTAISNDFNPTLGSVDYITAISAADPTVVTSTGHGLTTGEEIIISGSNSTPSIDGLQTVTVIDANNFSVNIIVTVAGTMGAFAPATTSFSGLSDVRPNRLWYSVYQQPEAVPLVNYIDVGQKNKAILRILPLRDTLFILKEEGVFYLTGNTIPTFSIDLFDGSTIIKSSDSAVILNNCIFLFCNQGIAQISTTGVQIISRPIENLIVPLLTSQFTNFLPATFAVGYESDRAYLLFTIVNTADTVATVCYRWNTLTQTWTSWDITKTCGVVNVSEDILYLGPSDTNYVEIERKTFTRFDQADREYVLTIPIGGVSGYNLMFGSLLNIVVDDAFVQTQYLTIDQFNRLLTLLDSDFALEYSNYYANFQALPGQNLTNNLLALATQLDTDTGLATHGYVAAITGFTDAFPEQQEAYNVITAMLNADAHTRIKYYPTSIGTETYESYVVSTATRTSTITLNVEDPYIAGPIVLYKSFNSYVIWSPHALGDPSLLKHVAESTILFQYVNFNDAELSYSSDLSPSFEIIDVEGEGSGAWGYGTFGGFDWGGDSPSQPFRTYIPVNKQKCRFINGQFNITSALETYSIYGISYTFNPVSNRAYR